MKILSLDEIDLEETYFHFDVRSIDYIEQYGFPPDIGNHSKNAEKTPKVFFSKGINGVLDIIDVWLIWRMNKDNENESSWTMEFLTEEYLKDGRKKNITFENMYEWLKLRKYYKLDLIILKINLFQLYLNPQLILNHSNLHFSSFRLSALLKSLLLPEPLLLPYY